MGSFRFVVLAFPALGCATAGSTWVSQPEPGPFAGDELAMTAGEHPIAPDEPRTSRFVAELESDAAPRSRPRLDRTVTLGETMVAPPERGEPAPVAERPAVSVTINNYVQPPAPAYSGYYAAPYVAGYHSTHGGGTHPSQPIARPSPAPNPTPRHPGQNWPALPSYGPSFPFKTAPASPWR
jgi:translation initiation factor IF-2